MSAHLVVVRFIVRPFHLLRLLLTSCSGAWEVGVTGDPSNPHPLDTERATLAMDGR